MKITKFFGGSPEWIEIESETILTESTILIELNKVIPKRLIGSITLSRSSDLALYHYSIQVATERQEKSIPQYYKQLK